MTSRRTALLFVLLVVADTPDLTVFSRTVIPVTEDSAVVVDFLEAAVAFLILLICSSFILADGRAGNGLLGVGSVVWYLI